jgi:hypothetical protein
VEHKPEWYQHLQWVKPNRQWISIGSYTAYNFDPGIWFVMANPDGTVWFNRDW